MTYLIASPPKIVEQEMLFINKKGEFEKYIILTTAGAEVLHGPL